MIHINRADGKHEWLTKEEFEATYGALPSDGPHMKKAEPLKKERIDGRFSLRELAKAMDVTMSYLSDLEHGRVEITPAIEGAYHQGLLLLHLEEGK